MSHQTVKIEFVISSEYQRSLRYGREDVFGTSFTAKSNVAEKSLTFVDFNCLAKGVSVSLDSRSSLGAQSDDKLRRSGNEKFSPKISQLRSRGRF